MGLDLKYKKLDKLIELLTQPSNKTELHALLSDLLTETEIKDLINRWEAVFFLLEGKTHREVQKKVGLSISKVTHAANLLKKNGMSATKKPFLQCPYPECQRKSPSEKASSSVSIIKRGYFITKWNRQPVRRYNVHLAKKLLARIRIYVTKRTSRTH